MTDKHDYVSYSGGKTAYGEFGSVFSSHFLYEYAKSVN
jgi:hypothetical protein